MVEKFVLKGQSIAPDPGDYWVATRYVYAVDYDALAARESLLAQEVDTLKAEYAQLEAELAVYKAHSVAPSIIEGLFDRSHVAKMRIAALEAELTVDNDLFQKRWREWQSERDALVDGARALESALQLIGNELSLHADTGPAGEAFRALLNTTFTEKTFVPTGAGGNQDAFVCCEGVGKHKPGCPMETKGEQS